MKPCRIPGWVLASLCLLSASAWAQVITEFPIAASSFPAGIAAGIDGNLWFTDSGNNKIGRMTTAGTYNEYSLSISPGAQPWGITAGPDGNLWFTEIAGRIGRITTAGVITEFSTGISPGAQIHSITTGPDGNLWFTENNLNKIGRINPTTFAVTEFGPTGITGGSLQGITVGPDGNLWFAEFNGAKIGRITTAGVITEFDICCATLTPGAYGIVKGPDGNLWFTEAASSSSPQPIGRITTGGVVTEFSAGMFVGAFPTGITVGADGNLWFAEQGGAIGRITPAGVITQFSALITSGASPLAITAGPDGNVWFTEFGGSRIGRITVPPPMLVTAVSRKVHGAAGTFDLPLTLLPLTNPTTEPRQSSTATIVMTFDTAIVSANAAVTESTAVAGVPTFSGNNVIVPLTGVVNQQYVTISLTKVASAALTGGSGSVRIGFLLGDVNGNRVVAVSDVGLVNAELAKLVTAANFLKDVNASGGSITVADKGITNANLAKALPAP